LDILAENTPLLCAIGLLLGLIFGSFLNVVIYRLPLMLQFQWRSECAEFLSDEGSDAASSSLGQDTSESDEISLLTPASCCPHCRAPIKPWHNIPLLGYLILGGKCASCKHRISLRYPFIELATGLITALLLFLFGLNQAVLFAIALSYALIVLVIIDLDHKLLPDAVTLPLLWLGIIANSFGLFADLQSAVWGAILGYGVLWTIFQLFKAVTGKEGMGYGDFKLLAAIGAWFGWQFLPLALLIAAVAGLLISVPMLLVAGRDRHVAFAFGPYLALAAWVLLLWREPLGQMLL
jgi:leader peptidase (prepilin peptidase)/N-methyltransferase